MRRCFSPLTRKSLVPDIDLTTLPMKEAIAKKLEVPGNPPIDLSPMRKEKLKTQINAELKPVLRSVDYESFDLDRAFGLVSRIAGN